MAENISIAWNDLKFSFKSIFQSKEKVILNYLNGSLEFGKITALMGSNGCGKTILLKCLNGSHKSCVGSETKIYLNRTQKIRTCFVSQNPNEHLLNGLKVKESLSYASKLKNSDYGEEVDHESNANNLMNELMISQTADTNVENCSGGQQKRISIALELTSVRKPNVLFIDEPTSGLDSDSAEVVIQCLKTLCRNHKMSVFSSIHQPNDDILKMFDNLYVLAKGGVCIYTGPPQEIKLYLKDNAINTNENEVPIEILLKISSKGLKDKNAKNLTEKTLNMSKYLIENTVKELNLTVDGIRPKRKHFKLIDFWYLLMRSMTYSYIVNWKLLLLQPVINISYAGFLVAFFGTKIGKIDGCFSLNTTLNKSCVESLHEQLFLDMNQGLQCYAILMFMMIQLVLNTISFSAELKIFFNQHLNRWYSSGSYFLAKSITDCIPLALNGIIYSLTVYYSTKQLSDFDRSMKYMYIVIMGMQCTQAFGSIFGIIFHFNDKLPLITSCGSFILLMMFANFFIPVKEFNDFLEWLSEFSFCKYVFNSLIITIYGFDRCPDGLISLVLYKLDINDDDLFWRYSQYLIYNYIVLKLIAIMSLMVSVNDISIQRYYKRINKKTTDISIVSTTKLDEYQKPSRNQFENKGFNCESNDNARDIHRISFEDYLNRKLIIAWVDLTLNVGTKLFGDEKVLLNNISGGFEFGTINGLMGSSGAGKTTLLRCLNGRSNSYLTSDTKIYLSKNEIIRACFICQDVSLHLLFGLTVKQTLIYASKLKNSLIPIDNYHNKNAKQLMSELKISDIANNYVENCSGGQHKRIVIAAELTSLQKPNLVFLDEPTTGLDSDSAAIVIETLKHLSRKHRMAVITSIHQPNSEILNMFDSVYVLAKGGVCVYSGPPQELVTHLSTCGVVCNEFEAPIERLLKMASKGLSDPNLKESYDKTSIQKQFLIQRCKKERLRFTDGIHLKSKPFRPIDLWYLLNRNYTYIFKYQWKALLFEFVFFQFCAFCIRILQNQNIYKPDGCIQFNSSENCDYSKKQMEEQFLLSQNLKYNLSVILLVFFVRMITTTTTFSSEVRIFFNEHRNNWYSTSAYYLTKSIIEFVQTLLILLVMIQIINFYDARLYFGYLWLLLFGTLCLQSYGQLLGIIFNENDKIALLFSVGLFVFQTIFCNFFVPVQELAKFLQWISNTSVMKLVFENIMILIYGYDNCYGKGFSSVLFKMDINDNDFNVNSILLVVYMIIFRIITLIILCLKANDFSFQLKTKKSNLKTEYSGNENIELCGITRL